MTKKARSIVFVLFAAALVAALGGCGNPLEGGSEPSGSILRILSVEAVDSALTPDILLTACTIDEETGLPDPDSFEPGLFNELVTVNILNDSRPNTPAGTSTNSFVTINRYRVDYAVLNMSGSLPSFDGGGLSVGIPEGGTAAIPVVVLSLGTKDFIRSRFPEVGRTSELVVRADITIWGEDAFQVSVKTEASFTMVITDYEEC